MSKLRSRSHIMYDELTLTFSYSHPCAVQYFRLSNLRMISWIAMSTHLLWRVPELSKVKSRNLSPALLLVLYIYEFFATINAGKFSFSLHPFLSILIFARHWQNLSYDDEMLKATIHKTKPFWEDGGCPEPSDRPCICPATLCHLLFSAS